MNIAITGYCGTGSSAVLDLLEEFESVSIGETGHYEHVPFYTPNGLFDLEHKLLYCNNFHRSDEALMSFKSEMQRLNDYDWNWFASYNRFCGNRFMEIVDEFLDKIVQYEFEGYWSYDFREQHYTIKGMIKDAYLKYIKNVNDLKHPFGKRTLFTKDNKIMISFVDEKEFYSAAKKFVREYLEMFNDGSKNMIFDHLLLPHDAYRIPNYFDDDFRLIIVDRDPRDMYILTKYVWPSMGLQAQYPKDINNFIKFWKQLREREKMYNDPRVLRIYFEELIYEYDKCVDKICHFLCLSSNQHKNKMKKLDPRKSINNTQNFLIEDEWKKEIYDIEKELSNYLYHFPYERKPLLKDTFNA